MPRTKFNSEFYIRLFEFASARSDITDVYEGTDGEEERNKIFYLVSNRDYSGINKDITGFIERIRRDIIDLNFEKFDIISIPREMVSKLIVLMGDRIWNKCTENQNKKGE